MPVVRIMVFAGVFLNAKDIRNSRIIATPGITSPAIACSRPMNVEPFAATVGISAISVSITISTTITAMIEMGRMRLP